MTVSGSTSGPRGTPLEKSYNKGGWTQMHDAKMADENLVQCLRIVYQMLESFSYEWETDTTTYNFDNNTI